MILLAAAPYILLGQELNCTATINDRQISGSAYDYVSELGRDIERYMNENRWTNDRFEQNERIRCQIQVVLRDVDSSHNYDADVILTLRRPVYNTSQESVTVILRDSNWRFHYPRNRSLIHDERQFDDLTTFLDFYAYILLGFDYDTFSELGGTSYFNRALDLLDLALVTDAEGWDRGFGTQRNRYWLVNLLTSSTYEDLRRAIYRYHRLGLDQFTIDPETARREVIEAIELAGENKQRTSRTFLFDLFFDTKYTELVSMFRDAPSEVRLDAYNLFRRVDPGHSGEYERLRN